MKDYVLIRPRDAAWDDRFLIDSAQLEVKCVICGQIDRYTGTPEIRKTIAENIAQLGGISVLTVNAIDEAFKSYHYKRGVHRPKEKPKLLPKPLL